MQYYMTYIITCKNIQLFSNLTLQLFFLRLLEKDEGRSMQRLTIRAKQCALVNAIVN